MTNRRNKGRKARAGSTPRLNKNFPGSKLARKAAEGRFAIMRGVRP